MRRKHGSFGSAARVLSLAATAILLFVWGQGCASGPPPTPSQLGWSALENGDWRSAQTHFAEALRIDAQDASALHGQARAQLAGRDPEGSLRSLGRLVKVDAERFRDAARPDYIDALDAAARRRLDQNQSEAALSAVRALAGLDPNHRGLARLLGLALVAEADRLRLRGDRDGAFTLYEEACQVTPAALEAWVGAVEILLEKKQGKRAIRLLEAARKTHPTARVIRSLTLQAMRSR